ncbi:MAG TPA: hypothetical protein VNJ08_08770 [Bacteriovoracaceae bacterium]|nr:hypothetical protein [Bacteriovoracaceae bacterium]
MFDEKRINELKRIYPDLPVSLIAALCKREVTQAQSMFLRTMLSQFRHHKILGSVEKETFLCIDQSTLKVREFALKNPDFYLPDFKIAIDVDGASHDQSISKMNNDATREKFYDALGILHLLVPNQQAMSCSDANGYCLRVLIPIILNRKSVYTIGNQAHAKAQKHIYEQRMKFINIYPELKAYFPFQPEKYVYNRGMIWAKYMLGIKQDLWVDSEETSEGKLTNQEILHTYSNLISLMNKEDIASQMKITVRTLDRRLSTLVNR